MTPPGPNRVPLSALCLTLVVATNGLTQPPALLPPVVAVEHATARTPSNTPRPPGAEPLEYTPIPATNLPTVPVPEPRPEPPPTESWRRNPRYARLTVDVRNGTAIIGGRAGSHAAAWELAEEVREWAEVRRVVVGKVELLASGGR